MGHLADINNVYRPTEFFVGNGTALALDTRSAARTQNRIDVRAISVNAFIASA